METKAVLTSKELESAVRLYLDSAGYVAQGEISVVIESNRVRRRSTGPFTPAMFGGYGGVVCIEESEPDTQDAKVVVRGTLIDTLTSQRENICRHLNRFLPDPCYHESSTQLVRADPNGGVIEWGRTAKDDVRSIEQICNALPFGRALINRYLHTYAGEDGFGVDGQRGQGTRYSSVAKVVSGDEWADWGKEAKKREKRSRAKRKKRS